MSDEVTLAEELAARQGARDGKAMAEWAIEPDRLSPEAMRRILNGIEEGDPRVLEAFREPDLSGEYTGEPTPQSLAEELGLDPENDDLSLAAEAWEEAARDAFWGEIQRILNYHLEQL